MTIEDAHKLRWTLVRTGIAYVHDFAIPTFWRANPSIGSPLGPEMDVGDGLVAQAFTGAVVVWDATNGARVLVE